MEDSPRKFGLLTEVAGEADLAEWDDSIMEFEGIQCALNRKHNRAGPRVGDLHVLLPNRPPKDFVWTWYHELLVQDHVAVLLREARLTGYELRPATAQFKTRRSVAAPRFWELVVTGWGGMAPRESGVHLLEKCGGCGYSKYTKATGSPIINVLEWDGSDFFRVWPYPLFYLVTGRVVSFIRDNAFTGALCVDPITKMAEPGATLSPGSVKCYLPPEKADAVIKKYDVV